MAAMKFLFGALASLYVVTQVTSVYIQPGTWGKWGPYCPCSKSCGGGSQFRLRPCLYAPCKGNAKETRDCNTQGCKVDGGWSDWSDYSKCTKSCKSGTQTRTRTCTNPKPAYGGKECEGSSSESRVCNNDIPCPVPGGWSKWGQYGPCSTTCRKGSQSRSRTCTNPPPANGGAKCVGDSSQSKACNEKVPCPAYVRFDPVDYKNVESGGSVTLTIVRSGDLQQSSTVSLSTEDGSAKQTSDYKELVKEPVKFQSGEKSKKVDVPLINDKIVEPTENFFAKLTSGSPFVKIVPAGAKATIRIDDDDSVFRFQKIQYTVKETVGKVDIVILRSGATSGKQTARVQTKDGTAVSTANGDFQSVGNPTPLSVVFAAGQKQKTISVNINDDKLCEKKEKFTVILSTNEASATVNDAFDVATVNVVDNEVKGGFGKWSSFSKCSKTCGNGKQYRTRECNSPTPQGGVGCQCVGQSKQYRPCNIKKYCPINGGWSDWSDYSKCTKSCKSGTQTRTRTCTNPKPAYGGKVCEGSSSESRVCNNDIPCPVPGGWSKWGQYGPCSTTCRKGSQSRSRTCTNPPPANGGAKCVGESSQSKACNEKVPCRAYVRFDPLNYKNVESGGSVTLTIVRSGDLQQSSTVSLSTEDGSAKQKSDYKELVKEPVKFQSGEKTKKVDVPIINDKIVEPTEKFFAKLTSGSPLVKVVPAGAKATIRIDDDDSVFRFQKIQYTVKETAGKVNIVILRSGATSGKQTARVQTKDGTAVSTANGDFQSVGNPTPLSVVFAAGQKQRTISININDDKLCEKKEKFTVILSTTDASATVNDAFDVATVYIIDNDVSGGWGKWSSWSKCNKNCGKGKQYRTRKCDNPAKQGDGKYCIGRAKQYRYCYIKRYCPINGGYGGWSRWSSCSTSCGVGSCRRRRFCVSPKPQYGGKPCEGSSYETRKCNLNKPCNPYPGYQPTPPPYRPPTRPPAY